jgi:hypothetical protein
MRVQREGAPGAITGAIRPGNGRASQGYKVARAGARSATPRRIARTRQADTIRRGTRPDGRTCAHDGTRLGPSVAALPSTGVPSPRYQAPLYRRARAGWAALVAEGGVRCHLCGLVITGAFDLDHVRGTTNLHPAHPRCNRGEGGRSHGRSKQLAWGSSRLT